MIRPILALLIALALAVSASGQGSDAEPDRRGEAWQPEPGGHLYRGVRANVVIDPAIRQRNTRGIDGAGICVVASATTNGRHQGIGDEVDKLWTYAQTKPGGHSPDKLGRQIQAVAPQLKYANYLGDDSTVLDRLSRAGYPIGATMNTGRLYRYNRIAHMVSLVHFDKQQNLAAVIDNNKPEVTAWMPATEFERRWSGGMGPGWAFVWDYTPIRPVQMLAIGAILGPGAILVYFAGLAAAVRRIRYS